MFSEGLIGGSNIEALEVWSLSECWPAQGNADVLKIRQKNLPDNFPVCWLLLHLSRFFTGISRTARAMWCFVAYVYNGREREEKERERGERERERERETERVPCRIILLQWDENCITYVFTRQFSRVLTPGISSQRFFTGISRRNNGELISLIGNQRVGIFPPKSEILFVLSLALIWYRNFQDRTIPLGGDTWPCFWRKEGII